jgi:hypothetical protein
LVAVNASPMPAPIITTKLIPNPRQCVVGIYYIIVI